MPYTIQQIINIAKVSQYLAANAYEKGGLFGDGRDRLQSRKIYTVRKSVEWLNTYEPDIAAVNATAYITIDDIGNDGDEIYVGVNDPVYEVIELGTYQKQSSDSSPTILAASIASELSNNIYGYTASSETNVITITARPGLGEQMDLGDRLIVTITPSTDIIPMTGLWGWYRADAGVTGTSSVSEWADQSGSGNSLIQGTANRQPALYADVLNGYPVVGLKNVVGTQARMTTLSNFPLTSGATVIMVASQNNTGGNADVNGTFLEYAQDSIVFRDFSSNGVYLTINSDSGAYLSPLTNGTFYTIGLTTDTTDITPYLNGVAGTPSGTSLSVTQQALYIFQNHLNANTGNKQFAEIIIYTRVLDNTELTSVFDYLRIKYNHY